MFPLSTVLFPDASLPLHVFEPRYQTLVSDCLRTPCEFGVVLISRGSEVGGGDDRVSVGTAARIEVASPVADGRWVLVVRGTRRVRVSEWLPDDPYPLALVEEVRQPPPARREHAQEADALAAALSAVRRARALLWEAGRGPALSGDLRLDADPEVAAWQLCAQAPLNPFDKQRLLETDDRLARLEETAALSAAVADDVSRLLARGI